MWLGMRIQVAIDPAAHGPDVDTQEDLLRVAQFLQADNQRGDT
jgi:CMP-2-keto-3-deoxyoctulosonic acid synthetase